MKDGRLVKSTSATSLKHKRRFCKMDGCKRIVKSQGVCQRHGAKPRKCKITTCPKQAQGNYNGMCKAHFRASKTQDLMPPVTTSAKEFPETTPSSAGIYCEPTLVQQDSVVSEDNYNASHHHHNKNGEESDGTSASAMTDEELQGLELWDEPLFSAYNSNRSEELAADLFGLLAPDQHASNSALSIEEWNGGALSRKEEMTTTYGDRVVPVSTVPSCSDYGTTLYYNHAAPAPESRDTSHSSSSSGVCGGLTMDYYNHDYPQAREAV